MVDVRPNQINGVKGDIYLAFLEELKSLYFVIVRDKSVTLSCLTLERLWDKMCFLFFVCVCV